ncbi:MAG: xanthine dehydrogenase family protein subunit M [Thermomicrobiales bacterium]|nr:xanthine dehydrogenase family protein subunit M [Thermomicrobiales bacterium]
MFPEQFAYHRPASVGEALHLLETYPDAKIIAGGHSLLPAMKLRLAAPEALIDIGRIGELKGIAVNGGVTIGAMTTYHELLQSAELKSAVPVIAETASVVGDLQVRSRGTLGGSLAHSDPAADFTAVMLALGASVTAASATGSRSITTDDLFVDLLTTSLEANEILTSIEIPASAIGARAAYEKHAHPASGYAVVGVAAVLSIDAGGKVTAAGVAVTGATSKATRLSGVEAALLGKTLDAATIAEATQNASAGLEVNGDVYASAEYRAHLVNVLAKRAISRAAGI